MSDLEEARAKLAAEQQDGDLAGDDGASIADRGANGEHDETEPELFPLGTIEGDKKTLKTLVRSGLPVVTKASLTSAKVDLVGGLPDPDKPGRVMVSHEPAKYLLIPQREGEPGDKKIVGWEVRVQLRATYSEPGSLFYSEEQVLGFLEAVGIPRSAAKVAELLGHPVAA